MEFRAQSLYYRRDDGPREGGRVPRERKSDMKQIVKKELDGRGYIVNLSTAREGENLIGRIHVIDAATEKTVARFVGVGRFDDLHLMFGLDATEGIARDILSQMMSVADMLRLFVPGASVREE